MSVWTADHDALCAELERADWRDPADVRNMDIALVVLDSPWLAKHDAEVRATILNEAAEWFENQATSDPGTAWFNKDAADSLRANAAILRNKH